MPFKIKAEVSPGKTTASSIIAGIDFGTTFSGVAWALSGQPESIEVVTSWDTDRNHCSDIEKAPTELCFTDTQNDPSWGYGIPITKEGIKWFKLLLLDDGDVPPEVAASSHLATARMMQQRIGKSPIELVGIFLKHLWDHAGDDISRSCGEKLKERCTYTIIITLPAIWPHYAQDRMRQAAQLAGMLKPRSCGPTTLKFISEPEAAAHATFADMSTRPTIERGDTFVVCDAGGGTVDLISYIVEEADPLKVKECVGGTGGLCGAIFLDEAFITLIKSRLGSDAWDRAADEEKKKFIHNDWEHGIKLSFTGGPGQSMVEPPSCCDTVTLGKRQRGMAIKSDEILSVFQSVSSRVLELIGYQADAVQEKVGKLPDYIILVGGFGRNKFLFDCIKKAHPHTQVLQSRGSKPWTAICRGAVVHGLSLCGHLTQIPLSLTARISRYSYGIECSRKWEDGRYLMEDRYWDDIKCEYKAGNQMYWFLNKGEEVGTTHQIRHEFSQSYRGEFKDYGHTVLISSNPNPSSRKDETVRKLITVTNTKLIRTRDLENKVNSVGQPYKQFDHTIEITIDGAMATLSVYFKKEKVASRNVTIEYHSGGE